MAASQPALKLQEIDEELHCAICLERYMNPRILPCSHTFCHDCLDKHITHRTKDAQFPCPNCRLSTPTPPNGAEGFQRNFMASNMVEILTTQENIDKSCSVCDDGTRAVQMCLDCHEYICQTHARDHQKLKATKNHLVASLEEVQAGKYVNEIRARQIAYCTKHSEERVRYYCMECKTLVCIDCVNTGDCPHTSKRQNISNAGQQAEKQLEECLAKLKIKIEAKKNIQKHALQSHVAADESLAQVEKKIEEHCKQLCQAIVTSKDQYIASIREKFANKCKPFEEFQTKIDKDLKQLNQAEQQLMMVCNYGNPAEMLLSHNVILQQQEKLETDIPNRDEPPAFTTSFVMNQSFRELFQKPEQVFGVVHHTAELLMVCDTNLQDDTEKAFIVGLVD